jgi:hypothetical protein
MANVLIALGIVGFLGALVVFTIHFIGGPVLFSYPILAIWSVVLMAGGLMWSEHKKTD